MKKFLFVLAIVFSFQTATAGEELAASMRVMGGQFGIIQQGSQNGKMEEAQLEAAKVMVEEIKVAKEIIPDFATTDETIALYKDMMADLLAKAEELELLIADAINNDPSGLDAINAKAVEINALRFQGHQIFRR